MKVDHYDTLMIEYDGVPGKRLDLRQPGLTIKPHSLIFNKLDFNGIQPRDSLELIIAGYSLLSFNLKMLIAISPALKSRSKSRIELLLPPQLLPILEMNRLSLCETILILNSREEAVGDRYRIICERLEEGHDEVHDEVQKVFTYANVFNINGQYNIYCPRLLYKIYAITDINAPPPISDISFPYTESRSVGRLIYVRKETEQAAREALTEHLPIIIVDMIIGFICDEWALYTYTPSSLLYYPDAHYITPNKGDHVFHELYNNEFTTYTGLAGLRYCS